MNRPTAWKYKIKENKIHTIKMEQFNLLVQEEYGKFAERKSTQFKVKKSKIAEHKKIFSLESANEGLGGDYSLIFTNKWNEKISATLDGEKVENSPQKKEYHTFFFDSQTEDMYFTKANFLYKWPHTFIGHFDSLTWGIEKYKGEIFVALYDDGKIVNSRGKIEYNLLREPSMIATFQDEIYCTEKRGLIKMPDKIIKQTGLWASGLCRLDGRLYFGGKDRIIYSYDGKKVELVCNVGFPIWCLGGIKEKNGNLLYCGGHNKKGVEVINLSNLEKRKTILEDKISNILSITCVPIKFCEDFIKKIK